jgi:hypothetical protein
LGVLPSC